MQKSEKIIFSIAVLVIVIFSAFGFYLIEGEFKVKSLAVSGHAHVLLFAYGAILFGLLMKTIDIAEFKKRILAVLMSLTYLAPIMLIYAGFTGNTAVLQVSGPIFEGLFVILWAKMLYLIFKQKTA